MFIEVIKIGGSLLTQPGAMNDIRSWLQAEQRVAPQISRVLLVGGGAVVDGLRAMDAANPLPDEASHWAAIEMLDTLGRAAANWFPEAEVIDEWALLRREAFAPGSASFCRTDFSAWGGRQTRRAFGCRSAGM